MEEKISEKSLGESLLNIETHGVSFLKIIIIPIVIFYLASSPQTAVVFIIEYFKVDPPIALLVIQYSFPILIGIIIARTLSIMWHTVFIYVIMLIVIVIMLPVLWFLRIFKYSLFEMFFEWKDKLVDKYVNRKKKDRKFFLSNQIITITIMIVLYFSQFYNNFVGNTWNSNYNKKLLIIANLHYYCQVTGSYNDGYCQKWKNELDIFNKNIQVISHKSQ